MSAMVPQITGVSIVFSTVCSGEDRRKYQSSVSLAYVRGIHRWSVKSPHKGPVTRKMFPFDDAIMAPCYDTEATVCLRPIVASWIRSNIHFQISIPLWARWGPWIRGLPKRGGHYTQSNHPKSFARAWDAEGWMKLWQVCYRNDKSDKENR